MASLVLIALLEFDAQQGLLPVAHAPSSECIEDYLRMDASGLLPRRDGPNTPQTVQFGERRVVSVSHSIEGPQYARNVYSFTVLMVLDPVAASGCPSAEAYSRAASGLARRLAIAETEIALLSGREGRKDHITHCLAQIYQQLTETGQCAVPLDESNGLMINLRLEEALPAVPPRLTLDDCVPRLVADLADIWTMLAEDAAFSRLVPLIDGERSIRQISKAAHVDLELARRAVADLT